MLTVGGVVSLNTVTVTGLEVNRKPRRLRATAVSVCEPLLVLVESQGMEYGEAVSSAPRFAPSSLNWTPPTVRTPTMVTLAVTVFVPPMVDPGVGDVMETIRLPSCADTLGAKNHVET